MHCGRLAAVALLLTGAAFGEGSGGGTVSNSVGMKMVLLPAGSFTMGSPPGTPMRQEEETPRQVTLGKAFRISTTEITQKQWDSVMGDDRAGPGGDDLPVSSVSWKDAQEFCARLSLKEGVRYRLPTEAEWEYACRAGTEPAALDALAWYSKNSDGVLHAVGLKQANAWGLFDLLGNAAEWTQDVYAPYPKLEQERDPLGPASGTTRVVRGGAYRSFAPAVRCAARTGTPEAYQQPHVGFRVVQELR